MKTINVSEIISTVSRLCQEANYFLPEDVEACLRKARSDEESPVGQETLKQICANAALARNEQTPICQDTGITLVYLEIGQDIHIEGGPLSEAVNEGVRRGYKEGYLRKSIVSPPFGSRVNTGDNTPAVIHTDIVPGDKLRITVMPKGGGSENMTRLFMLTPSDGIPGIISSVVKSVEEAGSNPCPPVIVGVGIGGTAEKAIDLSKRAVLRQTGVPGSDKETLELEKEILTKINNLGIGPQGYGGRITALAVHIETYPTHMATMPLAVTLVCHAARHKEAIL